MSKPTVSVIVPAYNAEDTLEQCLASLVEQSYDNISKIIVVDNGSTDSTVEIAEHFSIDVYRYSAEQSSYAARNFGLDKVDSELVAFTDADCAPSSTWIAELVSCHRSMEADLVGGRVEFVIENHTASEIYDATTKMNNQKLVKERGSSVTANLLVKKSVFDSIGNFSTELKSGGDVKWTHRAVEHGYTIEYCGDAVVKHPTRTLYESFQKHYRLGYGEGQKITSSSKIYKLKRLIISLLPRPLSYITTDLRRENIEASAFILFKLFLISWACRIVQGLGKIGGLYRK